MYDVYFNAIKTFVLYIRAMVLEDDKEDDYRPIVKWCLDNLGSVVLFHGTQSWFSTEKLTFIIKSDKDEFLDILETYSAEDVIKKLGGDNISSQLNTKLLRLFNKFTSQKLFEKREYSTNYTENDPEYSATGNNSRMVKSNINNIDLTFSIIKNHGIKSFIEYSIILQHLKKNITGIITDTCAEHEIFMLELLKAHNNMNNKIRDRYDDIYQGNSPFSLKGGNVFKLIKRNFILAGDKSLKHDNLSDWDFTVNMKQSEKYHESEKKFFKKILTNDVDTTYEEDKQIMDAHSDRIYGESVLIWNALKEELNIIRNGLDLNEINKLVKYKIMCIMAGNLMNDYSVEITSDVSDDIIDTYGARNDVRDQNLNKIRGIVNFKKQISSLPFKGQIKKRNNTGKNIRIMDTEIYNIIKTPNRRGPSTIIGFDLMRLGLMYKISFNIEDIELSFKPNAELLDYSMSKPYTIGSYLHGDKTRDFTTIDYILRDTRKKILPTINTTVHSYNLYWFINDILYIMKSNPRQPKHEKRLQRIAQAIYILKKQDPVNLNRWLKQPSYYDYYEKSNGAILIEEFNHKLNRLSSPLQNNVYSVSMPMNERDNVVEVIRGIIGGASVVTHFPFLRMCFIIFLVIMLCFLVTYYIMQNMKKKSDDSTRPITNKYELET
jgi:hypothetical protein